MCKAGAGPEGLSGHLPSGGREESAALLCSRQNRRATRREGGVKRELGSRKSREGAGERGKQGRAEGVGGQGRTETSRKAPRKRQGVSFDFVITIAPRSKRPGNRLRNEPTAKAEPTGKDEANETSALSSMRDALNLEMGSWLGAAKWVLKTERLKRGPPEPFSFSRESCAGSFTAGS